MRRTTLSLLLISASIAASPTPILFSRNMPLNCEFVSQVESDISIQGIIPDKLGVLEIAYFEEWTKQWTDWMTLDVSPNDNGHFNWTLQSMSVSQNFLYRKLRFKFAGKIFESEFGRVFGERCQPSGRVATPWVECGVDQIEVEHGPSL